MKEAVYWHSEKNGKIACELCPHGCVLGEGAYGLCRIRHVQGGHLMTEGYANISSAHMDPIEKKPLYHFHPGSRIFSIGGWGCNLGCEFCQNWSISQSLEKASGGGYEPGSVVETALKHGSIGIAYTYNEPLINMEYIVECARSADRKGLKNVMVTNGFINPSPAAEVLRYTHALNIDIKSIRDDFYRKYCRARLEPVLEFAKQCVSAKCHVEITNLVIPGLNDADGDISGLAEWVAGNLGSQTPLHLSAYHPMYKMKIPQTPARTLERARIICRKRLSYVYVGNVFSLEGQNTLCPDCGCVLVARTGYAVELMGLSGAKCSKCGRPADIIS